VEREQIKITFDDDHTILLGGITLGRLEAIENLAFMINTGFRRIKIFRLSFPNQSPAESDNPLMKVKDGKKDPPSKSIIPARGIVFWVFS